MSVEEVGDVRVWTMVLPFLPPSKNVYDNWQVMWKNSAKKKWERHVTKQARALQIPMGLSRVGLHATLHFASNRRRDPQNYAQALWHWVPDGLIKAGVLVDDDAGRIEIGPNWGLTLAFDGRTYLTKERRERTVITIASRVPAPRTEW